MAKRVVIGILPEKNNISDSQIKFNVSIGYEGFVVVVEPSSHYSPFLKSNENAT